MLPHMKSKKEVEDAVLTLLGYCQVRGHLGMRKKVINVVEGNVHGEVFTR